MSIDELNGNSADMQKFYNELARITQTQTLFDIKFNTVTEKLVDLNKGQHNSLKRIAKQLCLMRGDNNKAYSRRGISEKVFISLMIIFGTILILTLYRNSSNDLSAEYGKAKVSVTHHK